MATKRRRTTSKSTLNANEISARSLMKKITDKMADLEYAERKVMETSSLITDLQRSVHDKERDLSERQRKANKLRVELTAMYKPLHELLGYAIRNKPRKRLVKDESTSIIHELSSREV